MIHIVYILKIIIHVKFFIHNVYSILMQSFIQLMMYDYFLIIFLNYISDQLPYLFVKINKCELRPRIV